MHQMEPCIKWQREQNSLHIKLGSYIKLGHNQMNQCTKLNPHIKLDL